ncbi:hypothetical protein [Rhizobium leguminosarum]|uniref:hypothetical protein n=1 Tax=Rhizobium leguminosarum TaxID=384 RepID=UPI001441131B|nr:hypothetical protein [Rhizobium leguminosarum]MBY5867864.1 hypothetical protein [Rhizobium leguminosarum]NKM06501.1 hypothetical protein [Rhizobium leguminosarum bv. viciae]
MAQNKPLGEPKLAYRPDVIFELGSLRFTIETSVEQLHPFVDAGRGNSAVSQHNTDSWDRTHGEMRQDLDGDAAIGSAAGDHGDLVYRHFPGRSGEMKPRRRRDELDMLCKLTG